LSNSACNRRKKQHLISVHGLIAEFTLMTTRIDAEKTSTLYIIMTFLLL